MAAKRRSGIYGRGIRRLIPWTRLRRLEQRTRALLALPGLRRELRTLVPWTVVFFGLLVALRVSGTGLLLWSFAMAGGAAAYWLLDRSKLKRHVRVELYRVILVGGVVLALAGARSPLPALGNLFATTVAVQRPTVNIRSEPTTRSSIVATARRGDRLALLDAEGSWLKIRTADGKAGWVYSSLVKGE